MRTGQVAAEAGVNVQTLRYYERRGILPRPARMVSGYRAYPAGAVQLIRFIKRAQALGFTLDEVEALLRLRNTRRASCATVRSAAESKLADIDAKIDGLKAMKRALTTLIESCGGSGRERACPIIEALDVGAKARG
jgi:Hg(II)-responsive transcriptional regulator